MLRTDFFSAQIRFHIKKVVLAYLSISRNTNIKLYKRAKSPEIISDILLSEFCAIHKLFQRLL